MPYCAIHARGSRAATSLRSSNRGLIVAMGWLQLALCHSLATVFSIYWSFTCLTGWVRGYFAVYLQRYGGIYSSCSWHWSTFVLQYHQFVLVYVRRAQFNTRVFFFLSLLRSNFGDCLSIHCITLGTVCLIADSGFGAPAWYSSR